MFEGCFDVFEHNYSNISTAIDPDENNTISNINKLPEEVNNLNIYMHAFSLCIIIC
jgi:hypothetical protein